ncbi:hypothetical protein LARI1_G000719 [Lachnellula arida]|uniref:Uncharacterized protein n=1 Tax=Lachnellula arida TaxID=1316785 RepID=A0A8T9BQM5_9HELO|nr:hypothetical protein LARI1_G000719 [Lachnellula arida]
MTSSLKRPAEVTPSRRTSSITSTGLDNLRSSQVDEDISNRIRSLLLSRNTRRPPRTPFSSDDHSNPFSDDCDRVDVFDFGSAKSVTKSALHEARKSSQSLPEARMAFFQSTIPIMDGGTSRRPTDPTIRPSSSEADMSTAIDEAEQCDCCPLHPRKVPKGSEEPKETLKKFKFPRLILQNKRKQDYSTKTCFETSPEVPKDDAAIHETDLTCCPPCDPINTKPSGYIVSYGSQPDLGDIACFLAGCSPGNTTCQRCKSINHVRRSHSTSILGQGIHPQQDFKTITDGVAGDISKLGRARTMSQGVSRHATLQQVTSSPTRLSPRGSATPTDAPFHTAQSQDIEPVAVETQPTQAEISRRLSDSERASLQPRDKPTPQSLRTSSPISISATKKDDTGTTEDPEQAPSSQKRKMSEASRDHTPDSTDLFIVQALPYLIASDLANLKTTIEFADTVGGRVQDMEKKYEKESRVVEKQPDVTPEPAIKQPDVASPVGADVVVVQPRLEQDTAFDASSNPVAESLSQAARTADDYLQQSAWRNESLISPRPTPTIIESPGLSASNISAGAFKKPNNELASKPQRSTHPKRDRASTTSIGRYGNIGSNASNFETHADLTTRSLSPNKLNAIPLGEQELENEKTGFKYSASRKSPRYRAIPTRKSSRNRVLASKTSDTNSIEKLATKNTVSRKLSYDRLSSLRSISSVNSLEAPGTSSKAQDENNPSLKSTVHWLKDLLLNDEPYQCRLTALPPRTRRDENKGTGRIRSQTAPGKPVPELFLGAFPKPVEERDVSKAEMTTIASEAFTKTIDDLESLLNEALIIARQAADKEDTTKVPGILEGAVRMLRGQRKGFSEGSSVPSIHESLRRYSESSSSDLSDNFEETHPEQQETDRSVAVASKPTAADRPSGWPPTGRVSTPYPPNSLLDSKESISLGIPRSKNNRNGRSDNIQRDDPGPEPTETDPPHTERAYVKQSSGGPDMQRVPTNYATFKPVGTTVGNTNTREFFANSPGRVTSGKIQIPLSLPICSSICSSIDVCQRGHSKDQHEIVKARLLERSVPNKREGTPQGWQDIDQERPEPRPNAESEAPDPNAQKVGRGPITSYAHSLDGTLTDSEEIDFSTAYDAREHSASKPSEGQAREAIELRDRPEPNLPQTNTPRHRNTDPHDLRGKSHVSLREQKGFSLARSHRRPTIARDWSTARKRFSAAVACISTALVGIIVGIYAGEVPAIQYYIVDFHHYAILGNVFFFIALAIPTFFFWPLPLLHGRKPYILGAMSLAMPLLFPQAIAVGQFRSPYVSRWRVGLLLSRSLMGFCLGFANMNFKSTLTDLFGASLQSAKPHQEVVDEFDVRRHGGGMGIWLGLWTWSAMGSIGVGFMVGAVIINTLEPTWGFYISIIIIALVLLLNIITPEVRRSTYRRSVTEVKNGTDVSRRLARGEVKMHMVQTGPKWWGEEVHHGVMMSQRMLRQPGFLVMSLYVAWMYAQIVLIIVLLGSLMSKYYRLKSPQVGLAVTSVPVGAMLAIPFQSGSLFSRSRKRGTTDDDTFDKKVYWSSHLVRRAIFILVLPFAGLAYTLSSNGPPIPIALPIIFAALIGFLSNLAMAECHGIIMETFDTSDLQPGMTGRPRGKSGDMTASKRTNYSSFPRVASAFAITQGFGYLLAAAATGVGGVAERQLGSQAATGVMAGILLVLSLLLLGVLARFKEVQIIPDSKSEEMSQWRVARRVSAARAAEGLGDQEEPWRPVIIGNPTHSTRRMCLLEMGGLSRWSEIRQKNRLVDEQSLEAKHPNLTALENARDKLKETELQVRHTVRRNLSRKSSKESRRSDKGGSQSESGDLGGHREMMSPPGKGSRRRKSTIQE